MMTPGGWCGKSSAGKPDNILPHSGSQDGHHRAINAKYEGFQRCFNTPDGELQALLARHNAGAALSAKAVFKPTKEFHTARHTLYSAEENMEIDKVVPIAASVKTKLGRGGTGG